MTLFETLDPSLHSLHIPILTYVIFWTFCTNRSCPCGIKQCCSTYCKATRHCTVKVVNPCSLQCSSHSVKKPKPLSDLFHKASSPQQFRRQSTQRLCISKFVRFVLCTRTTLIPRQCNEDSVGAILHEKWSCCIVHQLLPKHLSHFGEIAIWIMAQVQHCICHWVLPKKQSSSSTNKPQIFRVLSGTLKCRGVCWWVSQPSSTRKLLQRGPYRTQVLTWTQSADLGPHCLPDHWTAIWWKSERMVWCCNTLRWELHHEQSIHECMTQTPPTQKSLIVRGSVGAWPDPTHDTGSHLLKCNNRDNNDYKQSFFSAHDRGTQTTSFRTHNPGQASKGAITLPPTTTKVGKMTSEMLCNSC